MSTCLFSHARRQIFCATLITLLSVITTAFSQTDLPENIDNGLRRILSGTAQSANALTNGHQASKRSRFEPSIIRDNNGRIMVEIHLNGRVPLPTVRDQLTQLGGFIVSESTQYREGALSAFVPVAQIAQIARLPGVLSMTLSHRPRRNAGATISGGVFVLGTDALNAQGLDGTGQTVGVLSDSYDTAVTDGNGDPLTIHAAQDVASGDLPGPGNPENPNPVVVLEDFNDPSAADEGRAMLQIVHDVAPKAKLAYATGFISKVDFANNVRKLRTDAKCSVIVDDILYTEEPMFSDGIISQAVDDVTTSAVLPGVKCAYFSSATNYQGGGYVSQFQPVDDAVARAGLPNQNVRLDQVPASLTSGGFHNFNPDPDGPVDISQTFVAAQDTKLEFSFQWNDPFDQTPAPPDRPGVTTDYNILVFDEAGNYLPAFSGTANNFATQEPLEDIIIDNSGKPDTKYQIVITRAGISPAVPAASVIRYLAIDNSGGVGAEEYYQPTAPSSHGHNTARGAISVAAYVYDNAPSNPVAPPFTPSVEDFSSAGPATIYFDSGGRRLATPEVRMKPEIAAPDGGNTTFFGGADYEGDGFPNFFGTSAAAPHAAALAALLLQKAGGPATLNVDQLRNILENSVTMQHDLDPFFIQGDTQPARLGRNGRRFSGAAVTVTGLGNSTNASSRDPNFFTITFSTTKRKEALTSVTIDLTNAGLKFDTTAATGFPLTLGKLVNISPSDIILNAPANTETVAAVSLTFLHNSFRNGTSVSFGIDRDVIGDGGGNSADLMEGGIISAVTTKNALRGVFRNQTGFGWTQLDGFGLIDGTQAAKAVNGPGVPLQ